MPFDDDDDEEEEEDFLEEDEVEVDEERFFAEPPTPMASAEDEVVACLPRLPRPLLASPAAPTSLEAAIAVTAGACLRRRPQGAPKEEQQRRGGIVFGVFGMAMLAVVIVNLFEEIEV